MVRQGDMIITRITIDAETREKLTAAGESVELVDETGKLIRHIPSGPHTAVRPQADPADQRGRTPSAGKGNAATHDRRGDPASGEPLKRQQSRTL